MRSEFRRWNRAMAATMLLSLLVISGVTGLGCVRGKWEFGVKVKPIQGRCVQPEQTTTPPAH